MKTRNSKCFLSFFEKIKNSQCFSALFSLTKAITEGCAQLGMNISQDILKLLSMQKDLEDIKYAADFHGVETNVQDSTTNKQFNMKLIVEESSLRDFKASWNKKEGTFLLSLNHQSGPVSAFAAEWLEREKEIRCLVRGEQGEKENLISPGDVTDIYRLSLVLEDYTSGAVLQTKDASQPPTTHPHTLTVSSEGPAPDAWWDCMGLFTRANIWPQWTNHESQTLYYDSDGYWAIGASTDLYGIKSEESGLSMVPRQGWMFWDVKSGNLVPDRQLEVTAGPPPTYPETVKVDTSGPAGDKWPECLGLYTQTGPDTWQRGRPVWRHQTQDLFLFFDGSVWMIGPDPTKRQGAIRSKKAGLLYIPHTGWCYAAEGGAWPEDTEITFSY